MQILLGFQGKLKFYSSSHCGTVVLFFFGVLSDVFASVIGISAVVLGLLSPEPPGEDLRNAVAGHMTVLVLKSSADDDWDGGGVDGL